MTENKQMKKNLILSETKEGLFGTIKIDTFVTNLFFDGNIAINNEINRFSSEIESILEINSIYSLDNTIEHIIINPVIKFDEFDYWKINFIFHSENLEKYYFWGCIGSNSNVKIGEINMELYYKVKAKLIKICNPNYEYKIEDIIDLLRESKNNEINKWLIDWDKHINRKIILKEDNF